MTGRIYGVLALLLAGVCQPVQGAIVITGTRVIYPAAEKEVSVKLENKGTQPVLVQSWVDDGDPKSQPETARAPFTLTPPINRVNPNKGQTLRVRYTGEALPQDKESVFYLNVLEVPPKVKDADNVNMLQMAFRTRIKLFFRPAGLKGEASEAIRQVSWTRRGNQVDGHNPTPYHVSLAFIASDKEGLKPVGDGGMIAPGGTKTFTLNTPASAFYPTYINDYGAMIVLDPQGLPSSPSRS